MILVCLRNSTQLKGDFRPFEYGISKTIFAKDFSLRIFGKPELKITLSFPQSTYNPTFAIIS